MKLHFSGEHVNVGLTAENVYGHITAEGDWNGRTFWNAGQMSLDSIEVLGHRLTDMADLEDGEAFLAKFGDKVPARLKAQIQAQKARLS